MSDTPIEASVDQPVPLRVSRLFTVPRSLVFRAWSSADHVSRWFCPAGYTIPEATVEMSVGGRFEICMRSPDGVDHWSRGTFVEVSPDDRLVIDFTVSNSAGRALFSARTEVSFANTPGGTMMDVVQSYTFATPSEAGPMVKGAAMGWAQTFDKLADEVARMWNLGGHKRSVVHASFHLERTYDAPVERVFKALSDEAAKTKWFGGDDGKWERLEQHMDFRVGGRERVRGRWQGGIVSTFDAVYHDIVPNERVVYTYEMHLGEMKISVSLATMQLKSLGPKKTTLSVTEQGAFLDGYDDAGSREHGTGYLLDKLGQTL